MPVPPGHRMLVRVHGSIIEGRACLGVLDKSLQRWLAAPTPGQSEVSVDIGTNDAVMLAFVNCSASTGKPGRVVFDVHAVSYAIVLPERATPRP
ncbi:MAG TPA: hypothetical protein VNT81_05635, partial [Vicinamibacterales bacterium]|nr:hypothetical protein [Vicinamibacterales bacterium]